MEKTPVTLTEAVAAILENCGITTDRSDDNVLDSRIQGEAGPVYGFRAIINPNDVVTFLFFFEDHIPEPGRLRLAEAMMTVNCGLAHGNFELNFQDGDARFRISYDTRHGEVHPTVIEEMVGEALYLCDNFHDVFMQTAQQTA